MKHLHELGILTEIKSIVGVGSHETTTWLQLEDYEGKVMSIELPTEELILTLNKEYMNHALEVLHKHLKEQVNGND